MIPSIEFCFQLMQRYEMLEHIKEHSIMVTRIARFLAGELIEAGESLSLEKITAGALMHDIAKTSCLQTGGDHAEEGRKICIRHHLDEIAPIVAEHVILKHFPENGHFSEEAVVYYSDKRVNHHRIVSLEERLNYILERYGRNNGQRREAIRYNFALCKNVEEVLFRLLPFNPEELPWKLERSSSKLKGEMRGRDALT